MALPRPAGLSPRGNDGLGLTEIGRFGDHDGYDGVLLEVQSGGGRRAPPRHRSRHAREPVLGGARDDV
ncbi:hypothetical protein [Nonomuraea roseoviolacea]|uniref:hypothetical protein n=1 Tax=Nonomuraea roseoviolacea TaxID=103837 RepID=UPI003CD06245